MKLALLKSLFDFAKQRILRVHLAQVHPNLFFHEHEILINYTRNTGSKSLEIRYFDRILFNHLCAVVHILDLLLLPSIHTYFKLFPS